MTSKQGRGGKKPQPERSPQPRSKQSGAFRLNQIRKAYAHKTDTGPSGKFTPDIKKRSIILASENLLILFCVTEGFAFKTNTEIYYEPKKGYFLSCYCLPQGYYGNPINPNNNVPCTRSRRPMPGNSTSSNAWKQRLNTSSVGSTYCVCNKSYAPYELRPDSNPEGLPVVYTGPDTSEVRCTIVGSGTGRYYSCDLACVYTRGSCEQTSRKCLGESWR
ncbi:hypothetical protein GUITHDRAFT_121542 [Guillardia theta CCMP2712]|uniref:Uncharacterized protein n=1 Tax=Guillardia theta (strain CCMP2712) TaxID=905079 RepID=L1I8X8_GUITC|nr:hypothetical protein GUITHDRAFT_121542 [Guillardia theta CCMP2712]EKX32280.1 hypothetical protein GUITHDRAFT_121542 [Guillardia theta CCMP2712]|eukprot:XP_005819260.1 hypothetical protein GUITHDRAFT_121542 [Guillardia theta CCMP2712]